MTTDLETSWKRAEELLDTVLDELLKGPSDQLPVIDASIEERVRGLSDDRETANVALRLLEQMQVQGDLFDRPITEVASSLIDDVETAANAPRSFGEAKARIIDRYRLVSVLGRGGMGVVYRAERADDQFDKEVALKLLPFGLETAEGQRRLRVERQILARLEHPGIARLLDGGVTEEGTPYLVMDLVHGRPIDRAAEEDGLPIRERIQLFLQVCDAIDYAHRNLVLHRDLKPSNCFVTSNGEIKLLDFGIGKLLGEDTDDKTLRQPLTLRYASPEQLRNEPVSVASDVYGLGLLLYRLLTGSSPWPETDDTSRSELRDRIESSDPPPPSGRIDDSAPSRLGLQASRRSLVRDLEGDLDRIVCKALEQRPVDRYPTARELGDDLRRHLEGRPVHARPITWRTRVSKFVARHRAGVAATMLLATLVIWAVASVIVQGQVATHERDRARTEALRAQRVARVLTQILESSSGEAVGSGERTAREMLVDAEAEIRAQLQENPVVLASMLEVMANPHASFGNGQKALELAAEAVSVLEEHAPDERLALARATTNLAGVRAGLDATEGVEEPLRRALETFETLGEGDSVDAANAHRVLGSFLLQNGRYEEAMIHAQAALQRYEQHGEEANVAVQQTYVALILRTQGRHQEAIELQRETLMSIERLYGQNHPNTSSARNNLANSLMSSGRVREAAELYRQSHESIAALFGADSVRTAISLTNLSRALLLLGDLQEANTAAQRAVSLLKDLGPDHFDRIGTQMNLGSVELARGDLQTAAARFEDGFTRLSARLGKDHPSTLRAGALLGLAHLDAGRLDQAEPLLSRALAFYRDAGLQRTTLPFGETLIAQALIEALRGRCPRALGLLSEAAPHLPTSPSAGALTNERRAQVLERCGPEPS